MHIADPALEAYAAAHSTDESPLLRELARETRAKTKLPQMLVGHLEGAFLRSLVRISRAKRVLEIGTFTGYSALAMAEGLGPAGRLITCDIDSGSTAIARKFWARSPHGKKIQLKLGLALDTLKQLKGPFDLVFIDADKENYQNYWEACLPLVRSGGLLVADNVLWSGRVLKPKDYTDRAIARFNNFIRRDPRVQTVMLTVRDGLTLALKK
jgi:caffeoyl-CoA O-methyltransferase